jgi:hypothetical protein
MEPSIYRHWRRRSSLTQWVIEKTCSGNLLRICDHLLDGPNGVYLSIWAWHDPQQSGTIMRVHRDFFFSFSYYYCMENVHISIKMIAQRCPWLSVNFIAWTVFSTPLQFHNYLESPYRKKNYLESDTQYKRVPRVQSPLFCQVFHNL